MNSVSPLLCLHPIEIPLQNTDQRTLSSFVYHAMKCWVHYIRVDGFVNTKLSEWCICSFKYVFRVTLSPPCCSFLLPHHLSPNSSFLWFFLAKAQWARLSDSLWSHIPVLREGKFWVQEKADKVSSQMQTTTDWYSLPGTLRWGGY